jgi:hypothetical protein
MKRFDIRQLGPADLALMEGLLETFDDAAIALYTKLGVRESVLHFDIPVAQTRE